MGFLNHHRHLSMHRGSNKGSIILSALIIAVVVMIMIMASTTFIQNRINQVIGTSDKMDHRIVLDGLFAYTVNGIKQSWCYTNSWAQDIGCTFTNSRNTVRLLLSDEAMVYIKESNVPLPTGDLRLKEIKQKVDLSMLVEGHPLYKITRPLGSHYTDVEFEVKRDDSAIATAKGREVPLRINIKIIAQKDSKFVDLELTSKVIVYPRELTYFGLVMPNDLYLNSNSSPSIAKGDNAFPYVPVGATKGLRFESPVFINGNVHLPPKAFTSGMANVVFIDKVVMGGGMLFQDNKTFTPANAGGEKNMYNHEMTSFAGLLGGFELDEGRDRGLDYLFELQTSPNDFKNFELCKARLRSSYDLTLTRESQLYSKAVSISGNTFNLSINSGSVDNIIEQSVNNPKQITTNVPGVTTAGRFTSFDGGAAMRVLVLYDGLKDSSGNRNSYFNEFYMARSGDLSLFPLGEGAGKPEVRLVTKPLVVNGKKQYNQIDIQLSVTNPAGLELGAFSQNGAFRSGGIRVIIEAFDYAYNFGENLRDTQSSHSVMGPYKINGFTFSALASGDLKLEHYALGEWYTNPLLRVDPSYPVYDSLQAPIDNFDYATFDEQCFAVPGDSDAFYNSFQAAAWTTSYATQARHAWMFSTEYPNGYLNGTLVFDDNQSSYPPVDATKKPAFKIVSLARDCRIDASANFVTGFYACETLTISARTTPLRIIGTFVVKRIEIDNTAYQAGIRWSSIYHPQATYELRAAGILGKMKDGSVVDCDSPTIPPLWQPNIGVLSAVKHYVCNPVSLRTADPFRWTTVDPDCGVDAGATSVKCKKAMTRFLIKEISRSKGM